MVFITDLTDEEDWGESEEDDIDEEDVEEGESGKSGIDEEDVEQEESEMDDIERQANIKSMDTQNYGLDK